MCGRFTLTTSAEALAAQFELAGPVPELAPRYNIAPAQEVAAVRVLVQGQGRQLHQLHWGLIPAWAKDPRVGYKMINARSETVQRKPSYRAAYRRRRCLVLADGFYEWKRQGRSKQPFLIRLRGGGPFAIAGLWERWKDPDGEPVESCTLLTCAPNARMAEIHDRMPVILQPASYDLWLDPEVQDPEQLGRLLGAIPDDQLEIRAVSPWVNNPRNDDARCLAPVTAADARCLAPVTAVGEPLSLFDEPT